MKSLLIKAAIFVALVTAAAIAFDTLQGLRRENERLRDNQDILLTDGAGLRAECHKYKVRDSLSAAEARALRLTLDEYKKYRSGDAELIKDLRSAKADLEKSVSAQARTITGLRLALADTAVTDTSGLVHVAKAFRYHSEWTDVEGAVAPDLSIIDINICNREELRVIETVSYKRFLGFLWKTGKVKSRQVNVVSLNPATEITACEYVVIEDK